MKNVENALSDVAVQEESPVLCDLHKPFEKEFSQQTNSICEKKENSLKIEEEKISETQDAEAIVSDRIEHPVAGIFSCILAAVMMVFVVHYMVSLPVCADCLAKSSNGLEARLYEMIHLFFSHSLGKEFFLTLGVLLLIGAVGLLSNFMDDALCHLPFGRVIRKRFDLKVPAIFRMMPAAIMVLYFLIIFSIIVFKDDFQYEIQDFSLLGKGYTVGMWISQIFYGLALLALGILAIESFMQSGIFGLFLRLPLLVISNTAWSVLFAIVAAAAVIILIVIMLLIILVAVLRFVFCVLILSN